MKGSITVFATLVMMLVSQFLFTLLEGARNIAMNNIARVNSESVVESIFAQYCRPLWDEYHLLVYDAGKKPNSNEVDLDDIEKYMKTLNTENFQISSEDAVQLGTSMLRLSMENVDFSKYSIITDDKGEIYAKEITSYMKKNLGYELARGLYSEYKSISEISSDSSYDDESIDNAMDSLSVSDNKNTHASPIYTRNNKFSTDISIPTARASKVPKEESKEASNPLVSVQSSRASGILSQVVMENTVSGNEISISDRVSSRELVQGTGDENISNDWYEKLLMQQYFLSYLSSYENPIEGHALNYEIEYLIGGKASDKDNLKLVVTELLGIREACNMMYLISSPSKQAQALALATALGAVTVNPVVIEGIKWGILAGWAYCESVLDVRALLAGDNIPVIKTDVSWTSNLTNIPSLLTGEAKAKSSSLGIGYSTYLGVLLMTKGTETLAYRAMDVQEATVRQKEGYSEFRMDTGICNLEADIEYKYHAIFLSFVNIINTSDSCFLIQDKVEYSYYT